MPNSYFSNKGAKKEINFTPRSGLTAVLEIMEYEQLVKSEKFHVLESFFTDLAVEIHASQRDHYRRGFGVIRPEFRIVSNHIYMYSFLYLEKNVPDVSSMIFNLFVETCNMVLAVALKHEIAIRGFAGIDELLNSEVSSGSPGWLEKNDTLMLWDMLKVFSFEEIFPEGLEKVMIPAAALSVVHAGNFFHADRLLADIDAIGIYIPENIMNYPSAELAIYSDLLIETTLNDKKMFAASWDNWANKHPDDFPVNKVRESIKRLSKRAESKLSKYWKNFSEIC